MSVMPMFPLGTVLLPGGVLPLHVFEPRYRQMVTDCVETPGHEFGVVFIERGSEVGGGEVRRMVGTVARMVEVAQMADGRFAVMSVGVRRLRVNAWLPDDPYPMADVDDWPDDDDAADGADGGADGLDVLVESVSARVRRAMAFALELGDPVGDPQQEVSIDPWLASHHLADLAPLSNTDRFDVLCAASTRARLTLLDQRLDDVETLMRMRLDEG